MGKKQTLSFDAARTLAADLRRYGPVDPTFHPQALAVVQSCRCSNACTRSIRQHHGRPRPFTHAHDFEKQTGSKWTNPVLVCFRTTFKNTVVQPNCLARPPSTLLVRPSDRPDPWPGTSQQMLALRINCSEKMQASTNPRDAARKLPELNPGSSERIPDSAPHAAAPPRAGASAAAHPVEPAGPPCQAEGAGARLRPGLLCAGACGRAACFVSAASVWTSLRPPLGKFRLRPRPANLKRRISVASTCKHTGKMLGNP